MTKKAIFSKQKKDTIFVMIQTVLNFKYPLGK